MLLSTGYTNTTNLKDFNISLSHVNDYILSFALWLVVYNDKQCKNLSVKIRTKCHVYASCTCPVWKPLCTLWTHTAHKHSHHWSLWHGHLCTLWYRIYGCWHVLVWTFGKSIVCHICVCFFRAESFLYLCVDLLGFAPAWPLYSEVLDLSMLCCLPDCLTSACFVDIVSALGICTSAYSNSTK